MVSRLRWKGSGLPSLAVSECTGVGRDIRALTHIGCANEDVGSSVTPQAGWAAVQGSSAAKTPSIQRGGLRDRRMQASVRRNGARSANPTGAPEEGLAGNGWGCRRRAESRRGTTSSRPSGGGGAGARSRRRLERSTPGAGRRNSPLRGLRRSGLGRPGGRRSDDNARERRRQAQALWEREKTPPMVAFRSAMTRTVMPRRVGRRTRGLTPTTSP